MRRHADQRVIAKLLAIQKIRHALADTALAASRIAERRAAEHENRAREAAMTSHTDWDTCLGRASFAPEVSRALAAIVVCRESEVATAAINTSQASSNHIEAYTIWCVAEARLQSTNDALTQAQRNARKRHEERRTSALSDRVTYDWSRR